MPKQLFCVADTMDGAIKVFQGGWAVESYLDRVGLGGPGYSSKHN